MKTKRQQITPQAALHLANAECAPQGTAAEAVNVREVEGGLEVVGCPSIAGQIEAGARLLLVDGDRYLCLRGLDVTCNGTVLATLTSAPVGAHLIGNQVVITTGDGTVWLQRTDTSYTAIDPTDALPRITLSTLEVETETIGLSALRFDSPYDTWQSPLTDTDIDSLTRLSHSAWTTLQNRLDIDGRYGAPMMVRFGVRLTDGSYLYLSEPVEVGATTLDGLSGISTVCTTTNSAVTGIPATSLSRRSFRLGITVERGVDPMWHARVKAVDILATSQASLVQANAVVTYGCTTDAQRRPVLRFSLPWLSRGAVGQQLQGQPWTVIATTDDISGLSAGRWNSAAVAQTPEVVTPGRQSYVVNYEVPAGIVLTDAEASTVGTGLRGTRAVASMTTGGRLLTIDTDGVLSVGVAGQPMVVERRQTLLGVNARAMISVSRPIYSNGFGRYPILIFTDDGIYALPQTTATGAYGEPRLLERVILAVGTRPVEGGRQTWFACSRGHLCRLVGSKVEIVVRNISPVEMAWDNEHDELLVLTATGSRLAVSRSGRHSERTLAHPMQLYTDSCRSLIVASDGLVSDPAVENAMADVWICWRSNPFQATRLRPTWVLWPAMGSDLRVGLRVSGERGRSCHGFTVSHTDIDGRLDAPLPVRLLSPPLRTLRLEISGYAPSGTLITPIEVI